MYLRTAEIQLLKDILAMQDDTESTGAASASSQEMLIDVDENNEMEGDDVGAMGPDDMDTQIATNLASQDGMEADESVECKQTKKRALPPVPVFEAPPAAHESESAALDTTPNPPEDAGTANIEALEDARPTLSDAPEDAKPDALEDARPTLSDAPEDAKPDAVEDARPTIPDAPEDATTAPVPDLAAEGPGFQKQYTTSQDSQNPFPEEVRSPEPAKHTFDTAARDRILVAAFVHVLSV